MGTGKTDGGAQVGAKRGGRKARAAKGVLIGLTGFVLILIVFALFFSAPLIRTHGLPAASSALAGSGFSIHATSVGGRPVSGVTFVDFRIVHEGSAGDSVTVFRADTLTVSYDLRRFLAREWRIESVDIAGPEILLITPPEGGVLLPGLKGSRESSGRGGGPTIYIEEIELSDARLVISREGDDEIFTDMDLECSYLRDPWSTQIGLKRASFLMPGRSLDVVHTSADLSLKQGVLYMEDGFVQLPSSAISFDGNISFVDGTRYDIENRGHPYDVPELAAILRQSWPEGLLEGESHVYGRSDSLAIDAALGGWVERYEIEGLDVECVSRPSGFSFSKVKGLVNGAGVDATGRVGDGSLYFDVDFAGLDASNGFFPGVAFPSTDLTGFAEVAHPYIGSPWFIEADMGPGQAAEFEFSSLLFRGDVVPGRVNIDSVGVSREGIWAEAAGEIGIGSSGQMDLDFRVRADSLDYAAGWLGADELQGSVTAAGDLSGPSSDPVLRASGAIEWMGRGPARIEGGSFEATVHGLADGFPVEFSVVGADAFVGFVPVGALELQGVYDGEELEVPAFEVSKADSSASGAFALRSGGGRVEVDFDRLDIALDGVTWKSGHPFSLSYEDGAYAIRGFRVSSGGGVLALSGRLDTSRDWVELNVAATGIDNSSLPFPEGSVEGGNVSGEITLKGAMASPSGVASVSLTRAGAFGADVRRMTVSCEFGEGFLLINRFLIDSSVGTSLVTGRAELGLNLVEILGGKAGEFFDRAAASPLDLSVSVSDLDLSWLGRTAQVGPELTGAVSVSGNVTGSLEDPELDLKVEAGGLRAGGLTIDSAAGDLEYAEGRLRLRKAEIKAGEVTAGVDGYLPLAAGIKTGVRVLKSDPMALEVKVEPGDFAVAAEVWEGLARSSGSFTVDARVTGTPSAPLLDGSGRLDDCALRLAGMEEEYREIRCEYLLKGDRVRILEIYGVEGKNGRFEGEGEITLAWPGVVDYSFSFVFEQMPVLTPIDFDAIVSGDLTVAAYELESGKLIPLIEGVVVVDEASYVGDIGGPVYLAENGGAAGTVTPRWLADLEIEIPGNLNVSNADADLLLAGDVAVLKDFDGLKPRGDLRVVSGTYYLLNTEFTVTSGTISFGEAVGINPDIDITAETVLATDESGFEERVYVRLTGNVRDPRIRVSSTSGYSESDIYNMLLAGTLWGQGPQEEGGPDISALATNTLFNAIDSRLRDLFGSRPPVHIDLTREQSYVEGSETAETRISVGRNLSRRLFLRYEQGFSAITRREVNLDYRVNRYLLLRSQIINSPIRGVREESGSEINFDLKLRYEF